MGLFSILLVCTGLLSVDARGLLAPKKTQSAAPKADDDDVEMMPPMEAFENVDNDVDENADSKELEKEEETLHSHHAGRMFGLHSDEVKDTHTQSKHQHVDPMTAVHSHRLGGAPPVKEQPKPVPVAKKVEVPAHKASHLNDLKSLVGADEEAPAAAPKKAEKKATAGTPVEQPRFQGFAAEKKNESSSVSTASVEVIKKMKEERQKEKVAAQKKVSAPVQAPVKPKAKPLHNLGKDLDAVSKGDMAPMDAEVVAKLSSALPSTKKAPAAHKSLPHEHMHGDAIGRLHASAKKAKATTETHTTTVAAAPRKASPQQLAAARRAESRTESLTDALRSVNASDVKLNLDISQEDAEKFRQADLKKKEEAETRAAPKQAEEDHMGELRAVAEKTLEAKVHQLESKNAKKAAPKKERSLSKLAEALGIDASEEAATVTTTVAPAKATVGVDPIKALHQRLQKEEPKKQAEKAKPAAAAPVEKKETEEKEEGVISGFHHNKARDNLAPVLR